MTVTTYNGWVADGRPYQDCQPTRSLVASLRRHGYTGPASGIGDQSHMTANPPQDHTPFSHTPWPDPQPYPHGMAYDIMPDPKIDWRAWGQALVEAKLAGDPALAPIKYINWTDAAGNCWEDRWEPDHVRVASSDRGHTHVSFRTDYVDSTLMDGWEPEMPTAQEIADALLSTRITTGGVHDDSDVPDGYSQPLIEYIKWLPTIHDHVVELRAELATVRAELEAFKATPAAAGLVDHTHPLDLAHYAPLRTGPAEAIDAPPAVG